MGDGGQRIGQPRSGRLSDAGPVTKRHNRNSYGLVHCTCEAHQRKRNAIEHADEMQTKGWLFFALRGARVMRRAWTSK